MKIRLQIRRLRDMKLKISSIFTKMEAISMKFLCRRMENIPKGRECSRGKIIFIKVR